MKKKKHAPPASSARDESNVHQPADLLQKLMFAVENLGGAVRAESKPVVFSFSDLNNVTPFTTPSGGIGFMAEVIPGVRSERIGAVSGFGNGDLNLLHPLLMGFFHNMGDKREKETDKTPFFSRAPVFPAFSCFVSACFENGSVKAENSLFSFSSNRGLDSSRGGNFFNADIPGLRQNSPDSPIIYVTRAGFHISVDRGNLTINDDNGDNILSYAKTGGMDVAGRRQTILLSGDARIKLRQGVDGIDTLSIYDGRTGIRVDALHNVISDTTSEQGREWDMNEPDGRYVKVGRKLTQNPMNRIKRVIGAYQRKSGHGNSASIKEEQWTDNEIDR